MQPMTLRRSLAALALLLVAAPLRAGTIKVPSQQPTIQAGINAALPGDTVSVSKGVYKENVVIDKEITLKGSSATISGRYLGPCITISVDNVTVQSFTLLNGSEAVLTDGEPGGGGVMATGTGITLSKLTVAACSGTGIRLVGRGTVDSCKVDGCISRGISVSTGDSTSTTITAITKNTVTHCNNGITASDGPFDVSSNTCTSNDNEGIEADLGPATVATTITKNKCNSNLGTGIIVSMSPATEVNVDFEKNTMDGNATGCGLEGARIDATSNTISDSVDDGLAIDADDCTFQKNTVKNNGGMGIRVNGASNALTKNTVMNATFGGIKVTGDANTLVSNTVKDSAGDGIEIESGADGNILDDNTVSGNDHDGIDNSGLDTIIASNSSKTNGGADIAGAGDGLGTVNVVESTGTHANKVSDDSDLVGFTTVGQLDLL